MPQVKRKNMALADLKGLIEQKWPDATYHERDESQSYKVSSACLKRLVPGGIPGGQLVEICGGASSGKTSFLFKLLSRMAPLTTVAYFDFAHSFHPAAAVSCGNDVNHFLLVRPRTLPSAVRAAELLLEQELAQCLVFDLVGQTREVPRILLHRLRQQATRARILVIFLTEESSRLIPASMVSLRLTVEKVSANRIVATVTRSRISPEGIIAEFAIDEL